MTGVEVVGFILSVLPLVISSIEHYDDILRPIRRYRQFTSKAGLFCDELETERAVFEAECQLLLGTVVGVDVAIEMLGNSNHPLWRDDVVCLKFGSRLGKLGTVCLMTVEKVNNKLEEIGRTFKELSPDPSPQDIQSNPRGWLHHRRKKLKFAFSEGSLRGLISELRVQNNTFRVISNQIVRFDKQTTSTSVNLPYAKKAALKKYQMIQRASGQLYGALGRACTSHGEHLAMFSLEATCEELSVESSHPEVRFSLTYMSESPTVEVQIGKGKGKVVAPSIGSAPTGAWDNDSRWFEVESILDSKSASKGKTRDRTGTNASQEAVDSRTGNLHSEDLCVKLRASMGHGQSSSTISSLVLVLNDTEQCKHSIYYPSVRVPRSLGAESTSLTQLLSPKQLVGNVPQLHRLRIAKSLALAALQFHTTPWLSGEWESEKLLLSKVQPMDWQSYTPSPHLVVRVSSNGGNSRPSATAVDSIIPNVILFNLGVMLLELAYGLPFRSLLQPADLESSTDAKLAKFAAARRLASNVDMCFGAGYAAIVRKCLRCDFGEGEDLRSSALQERLFEDVVCRLEGMEKGILKSQGGF